MNLLLLLLRAIGAGISRLLEPAMVPLNQLDEFLRTDLAAIMIPSSWHHLIITVGWAILLAVLFRALDGWKRIVLVLVTGMVLLKVYGVLPPPLT